MGIGWRDATLAIVGLAAGGAYSQWREYDEGPIEGRGVSWSVPDTAVLRPLVRMAWSSTPTVATRGAPEFDAPALRDYPTDIKVVGPRLVVVAANVVTLLDSRSGQVVDQLPASAWAGAHGEATKLQRVARDPIWTDVLWMYDFTAREVLRLHATASDHLVVDSTVHLHARSALRTPFFRNGYLLASGYFDKGLLMEFDQRGRPERTVGLPPVVSESVPVDIRHHMNFGTLAPQQRGTLVAIMYQAIPRIDILQSDGTPTARLIWGGDDAQRAPKPVKDKHGNWRFAVEKDWRASFLAVDGTSKHIFALYGGARLDAPNDGFSLGKRVVILRWDGTLEGELLLDRGATNITVNEDESTLFATGRAGEPIVGYALQLHTLSDATSSQQRH
jgi:hypothetical protein